MQKSELVNIIRTIVKEEVNTVLPQLLMEVLAERLVESGGAQSRKVQNESTVAPVASVAPTVSTQQKTQKRYTSNPILNKVLQETVGGVPQDEPVLNVEAGIDPIGGATSIIDTLKSLPKEVLSENRDVAAVANVLNTDFRSRLKVIDKKVNERKGLLS